LGATQHLPLGGGPSELGDGIKGWTGEDNGRGGGLGRQRIPAVAEMKVVQTHTSADLITSHVLQRTENEESEGELPEFW